MKYICLGERGVSLLAVCPIHRKGQCGACITALKAPPPTQPLGSGFVSEVHLFSRLGSAKDGRVGIGDLVERLRDGSRLQLQPGPLCSLLCKQTDVTTSVQAGIEQAARTRVRTEMSLAPPQVEKET